MQFFVNIELGDLTMGAAATVGTKESAFPGEHGQVASYLVSARVVTASGGVRVFDESDPDLMRAFRSSHGTFGITCEVTFRVRPIQPMSVRHDVYKLDDYLAALPGLLDSGDALMMFLDPLGDRIAVERRRYHDTAGSKRDRPSHWQWRLRNKMWRDVGPGAAYLVSKYAPRRMRDPLLSLLTRSMFPILRYVVRGRNTVASDQQINYPPVSNDCKYTFSIWTFPVERYPEALRAYFDFCKRYRDEHGFRLTLPSVGYRTFHDRSALLSYTYDGDSLTIDPVSNPLPGWDEFLHAYNEFAKRFDGTPLLNQSKHIDRASAAGAFGERLDELARRRREIDPAGRFLSPFFAEILG
jgi:FAD/FMN-containing dehydrogenase